MGAEARDSGLWSGLGVQGEALNVDGALSLFHSITERLTCISWSSFQKLRDQN